LDPNKISSPLRVLNRTPPCAAHPVFDGKPGVPTWRRRACQAPGCDASRRPGQRCARRGVQLGRPKARPRRCAGVRWPGSHTCTRPRARRVALSPGSRGCARRCRRGALRWHLQQLARVEARLTHNKHFARRQRARGEGCATALARRGGHPCSPAGRRANLERTVACAGHSCA
jgi:hypothetical protein